ncbi:flagellar motor switch protein FliN [Nocardioides panacis]|nr:flagellar motor switch protein FliN [Nocardioides panacis]
MTTAQVPTGEPWMQGLEDNVVPAAAAVAQLLPSAQPLTAGQPMTPADLDLAPWPAAGVASLSTGAGSSIAVLVGADLTDALAAAPDGGLELAAAIQPALDAAADALQGAAGAGRSVTGPELAALVSHATVAVPLLAGGVTAAVLVLTLDRRGANRPFTSPAALASAARGVELLHGVAMEVTVELGRTRMSVRELLALCPGDVLELDRAAGSPADLLVNGRLIARGEVVVVDEDFALRVTEIVAQSNAS